MRLKGFVGLGGEGEETAGSRTAHPSSTEGNSTEGCWDAGSAYHQFHLGGGHVAVPFITVKLHCGGHVASPLCRLAAQTSVPPPCAATPAPRPEPRATSRPRKGATSGGKGEVD